MNSKKLPLRILKIGGNILDDERRLDAFLRAFAAIPGAKILVHGGGKLATRLAEKLGIPQTLVEGRRVTDADTLRIVAMVYGGLVNKQIVAKLQALACPALGVCGADGDLLRAHRRVSGTTDFGFVGDVDTVNAPLLHRWLGEGLAPVVAPLTHDGAGQLLNTNADTIAQEIAKAMSRFFRAELVFIFEKPGVLLDVADDSTLVSRLDFEKYKALKARGAVSDGMLPKLQNAFSALESGVEKVVIGQAERLEELLAGNAGTTIVYE